MYVNQSGRVGGKEKEMNEEKDKSREVELEKSRETEIGMSFYIQSFVFTVFAAVLSKLIVFLVLRKYIKNL